MKKLIFIFSFFLIAKFSFAQANLVPNPSFELFSSCPSYQGQVNRLLNWYDPNQGSSDFLAVCATNQMVAVPVNFVGTQNARTGNNYAGFGDGFWTGGGQYPFLAEYLQVQVTQVLQANTTYYVSFYVSLADSSEYYTQSIAASFGDTAININYPYPLHLPPHIVANTPLNDTLNWQKIEGYYHAQGGEQYLTIGYFKNDTTTIDSVKFQNIPPGGILDTGLYYYLDDVTVLDSIEMSIVENNTAQYITENYILNSQNNFSFYSNLLEQKNTEIEIVDLLGREILSTKFKDENICKCIDLQFLKTGTYVYSISIDNIIKQRGFIIDIKN